MSLPVSPMDLAMLLKTLWKLSRILRHEAVDDFRQCAKTYKRFARLARDMNKLIEDDPSLQEHKFLRNRLRDAERVLRDYFNRIQEFRPHLGAGRVRGTLSGVVSKVRWVRHASTLEGLHRDLEFQLSLVNSFVAASRPNPTSMRQGSHFVLDDARCKRQAVFFSDIPDWEHFQQLLAGRLFPPDDDGHDFIKYKSYVLRNVSTATYILPSSPGIQLFRKVINPDDRVEMSVIAPSTDGDNTSCPRCGRDRNDLSSVDASCNDPECGLQFHFFDAFDDQPDPLTQLAIDDLRRSGLRKFVSGFIEELAQCSLTPSRATPQLRYMVRLKALSPEEPRDLWGFFANFRPREAIKHFHRIALCTPCWPSVEPHLKNDCAKGQLRRAMAGVKRSLNYLRQGSGLAFQAFGKAIGSRIGGRTEPAEQLMQSLLSQYGARIGPHRQSRWMVLVLGIHGQQAQQSAYQFQPSVVRLRCLLWIFFQVLTLEAKILSGCSAILAPLGISEKQRRFRPNLLEKAGSCFFIPHVVICRLTVDIIGDIAEQFRTPRVPPHLLGAIFRLVRDSRGLCLSYVLDGNLRNCDLDLPPSGALTEGVLAGSGAPSSWQASYRDCVESVVSSEGRDLQEAGTIFSFLATWK